MFVFFLEEKLHDFFTFTFPKMSNDYLSIWLASDAVIFMRSNDTSDSYTFFFSKAENDTNEIAIFSQLVGCFSSSSLISTILWVFESNKEKNTDINTIFKKCQSMPIKLMPSKWIAERWILFLENFEWISKFVLCLLNHTTKTSKNSLMMYYRWPIQWLKWWKDQPKHVSIHIK